MGGSARIDPFPACTTHRLRTLARPLNPLQIHRLDDPLRGGGCARFGGPLLRRRLRAAGSGGERGPVCTRGSHPSWVRPELPSWKPGRQLGPGACSRPGSRTPGAAGGAWGLPERERGPRPLLQVIRDSYPARWNRRASGATVSHAAGRSAHASPFVSAGPRSGQAPACRNPHRLGGGESRRSPATARARCLGRTRLAAEPANPGPGRVRVLVVPQGLVPLDGVVGSSPGGPDRTWGSARPPVCTAMQTDPVA